MISSSLFISEALPCFRCIPLHWQQEDREGCGTKVTGQADKLSAIHFPTTIRSRMIPLHAFTENDVESLFLPLCSTVMSP
jgi:hypothetical protein